MNHKCIAEKIRKCYEEFTQFNKAQIDKRKETWNKKVSDFNDKMMKGSDVRTHDNNHIEKFLVKYDIRMTSAEDELYQDNCCFGDYLMKSSDMIDPAWAKNHARKLRLSKYNAKDACFLAFFEHAGFLTHSYPNIPGEFVNERDNVTGKGFKVAMVAAFCPQITSLHDTP